ncbi:hypothetical protein [Nocardia sp. JMUB6875]|uniref:hypothetical protein n=1 Tax=Nocardia sp. JMUB6875 TaxID=3158170 RepID=UPI0034E89268
MVKLWENAWTESVSFLDCDVEISRALCSTNAILFGATAEPAEVYLHEEWLHRR